MNRIKRSSIALLVILIICLCLYSPALSQAEESSNELFDVRISTGYLTPWANPVIVVTLYKAPFEMLDFEFLISYDTLLMSVDLVRWGNLFCCSEYCNWINFSYQVFDSSSDCSNGNCIPGTIKVSGTAVLNPDLEYPNCSLPNFATNFLYIYFRLSSNIDESCKFIPVTFAWNDCYDNTITFDALPGNTSDDATTAVADKVYTNGEVVPPVDSFPSFAGPADSCITNSSGTSDPLKRLIEFHNGGIYLQCDSSDYLIGDIDLDGLPYQSSDSALFREYFLKGESAFSIHPAKQRFATDINKDGELPQINDLVQLGRIISEELHPDSVIDEYIGARYRIFNDRDNRKVSLLSTIAAPVLWLKFYGEITPVNVAENYVVEHHYDGIFTRIIMENHISTGTGDILLFEYEGNGNLYQVQGSSLPGVIIEMYVSDNILNCGLGRLCRFTNELGDVNLNYVSCEVADWVMFQNYFVYGEQIFSVDLVHQIYNTDVNVDSLFATIEDLVLLTRIITGDAFCATYFDSTSSNTATFRQNEVTQQIEVVTTDSLGAVVLVFNGEINPTASDTSNFSLGHNFDNGLTRVLIMPNINNIISLDSNFITEGILMTYTGTGQLIEAHTATNMGVKVNSVIDISTDIAENPDNLPTEFALYNNYPNPFNIETTIKFDLPRASEVSFEIINILGQTVYNVTNRYSAGSHTIYWDGTTNSGQTAGSGVYYYRITARDFVSSKKMILLK